MSLAFAQTAQASNFITPFGATQVYQVEEQTYVQTTEPTETEAAGTEVQAPAGVTENQQPAPGAEENQQPAPGPMAAEEVTVTLPSASYSTKEPVAVNVNTEIALPEIAAEGAVLYDVTHDKFLFEKNADKKFYPASITKILTALLVLEHAKLDETVTYSKNAVTRLESGAVTLGLAEGDQVSVKDSLYGLMLKSANEVANGLAEHVGGSIYGFADMMNAKAKELGCTGSHFVNPNGLNDSDHYTTAHDMALIAKAAFENETLCKITSTTSYKFPATKNAAARTVTMGHKMLYESDSRYYEGIVGGKTGYTSLAGNTLVTCVERDGVRMIAVILKSRSTHYADTKALLDYGYEAVGSGTAQNGETGAAHHKWIADGSTWRFELADGTRLSNCFVTIDGIEYAFDTEGKMVTGWLTLGQNWHYFGSTGAMVKSGWRQDAGLWFYLGENGAMMKNAWIDNQYYVGADGVWVQ